MATTRSKYAVNRELLDGKLVDFSIVTEQNSRGGEVCNGVGKISVTEENGLGFVDVESPDREKPEIGTRVFMLNEEQAKALKPRKNGRFWLNL
jgi:hypothetical protein